LSAANERLVVARLPDFANGATELRSRSRSARLRDP